MPQREFKWRKKGCPLKSSEDDARPRNRNGTSAEAACSRRQDVSADIRVNRTGCSGDMGLTRHRIWLALFLSTLETTIVSTSLVAITDALSGFDIRNWVVTSYLLTYTGKSILSTGRNVNADVTGFEASLSFMQSSRPSSATKLCTWSPFSSSQRSLLHVDQWARSLSCMYCLASVGETSWYRNSIILRAFQGIGASGIYSMTLVLAPTLVPKEEYGKYIGIISSVFALASVLGPIMGGAISTHSTWRWVFLLK